MNLLLSLLSGLIGLVVLVFTIPSFVVLIEVLSYVLRPKPRLAPAPSRPRVSVVMPAHNEALGIAESIKSVQAALGPNDRLLVVADNCTDHTATLARELGADVVERSHKTLRGKGYALSFGLETLQSQPPDVVVIVDADCLVSEASLGLLAGLAMAENRPCQALYLMQAPEGASLRTRMAEFAWRVKNQVRPGGAARLGVACQLMGTGMAFPWSLIEPSDFSSGHLVEDMELGVALALKGKSPLFVEDAHVSSRFPTDAGGEKTQRTRWEHGHVSMIVAHAPALLQAALSKADARLFAFALDLSVPPLALLVLCLVFGQAVGILGTAITGLWAPALLGSLGLASLTSAVLLSWGVSGKQSVSLGELLGVPLYVFAKVPVYLKLLGRRQMEWVRTRRD